MAKKLTLPVYGYFCNNCAKHVQENRLDLRAEDYFCNGKHIKCDRCGDSLADDDKRDHDAQHDGEVQA